MPAGCLAGLAAALGVALVVVVGLLVVFLPPYLERRVQDAARERGLVIHFAALHPSFGRAELEDVDVRLVGVVGIEAKVDRVVVRLDTLTPVAAAAHGVHLRLVGSAPVLALALAEWTRAYPATYRVPFTADSVTVEWRESAAAAPWLTLERGTLMPAPTGGIFAAERARIAGVDVGRVTAAYTAAASRVALGFGAETPSESPLLVVVEHAAKPPSATITLRPTALERLAKPLGVPLPVSGVTASGEAVLVLPSGLAPGPVTGRLSLSLVGYIPPHPVELNGFVFGNTTTFATDLTIAPDRLQVELTETRVTAGRFEVRGKGDIVRSPSSARVRLGLRGELPCAALADAAVESRLGKELGRTAGALAREFVRGTVTVLLHVDADTGDLAGAKLVRTIGLGCGLRPIPIPGLGTIDLSGFDLRDLPALPPGLPTSLPPFPPPIDLPLPSLGDGISPKGLASSAPP